MVVARGGTIWVVFLTTLSGAACGTRTAPLVGEARAGEPAQEVDGGSRRLRVPGRDGGPSSETDWRSACAADLVLVTPRDGAPDEAVARFDGVGAVEPRSVADVYFLIDMSFSMEDELDTLREQVLSVIEGIRCGAPGRPAEAPCVEDLRTGLGTYAGSVFQHRLSPQPDHAATAEAMGHVLRPEAYEALFQSVACVADRDACPPVVCATDGIGCAGFREDARRAVVVITDEPNQCPDCPINDAEQAAARLREAGVTFAGVSAGGLYLLRRDLEAIAIGSGSLRRGGHPMYFLGADGRVGEALAGALEEMTGRSPHRVSASVVDDPRGPLDAHAFVDGLRIEREAEGCTAAEPVEDGDGDGLTDTFTALMPDVPVCWSVRARARALAASDVVRTIHARLEVAADGAVEATRSICIVVPPG